MHFALCPLLPLLSQVLAKEINKDWKKIDQCGETSSQKQGLLPWPLPLPCCMSSCLQWGSKGKALLFQVSVIPLVDSFSFFLSFSLLVNLVGLLVGFEQTLVDVLLNDVSHATVAAPPKKCAQECHVQEASAVSLLGLACFLRWVSNGTTMAVGSRMSGW